MWWSYKVCTRVWQYLMINSNLLKFFKSIFNTSYVHREYNFTDTIECTIKISLILSHSVLPLPIPEATTVTDFLCNLPEIFYTQRSTCMGCRVGRGEGVGLHLWRMLSSQMRWHELLSKTWIRKEQNWKLGGSSLNNLDSKKKPKTGFLYLWTIYCS